MPDIVPSNAGIVQLPDADDHAQLWPDVVGTNMTCGFHAINATVQHLVAGGRGGVIILTGSTAGVRPIASLGVGALAYTASKWGLAASSRRRRSVPAWRKDGLCRPDLVGVQECGQGASDCADEAAVLRESLG